MESYYHILFDKLPEDQLESKRLRDLVTIVGGGTPPRQHYEYFCKEEGISWIQIRDITSQKCKFISRGTENITQEGFESCSSKIVPEGSLLFTICGTIAKIAIADNAVSFNPAILALNCKSEKQVNNFWIYFFLKLKRDYFLGLSIKTTRRGKINLGDLNGLWIQEPSKKLIEQFNQICEPFFQIQKTNEREIRELLKLQKYFIELTT